MWAFSLGRVAVNLTLVGPQNQCVCACFVGAWEWEHLQEALEEKLKNSLAVAQLMERIRSLIGRDRVRSSLSTNTHILFYARPPEHKVKYVCLIIYVVMCPSTLQRYTHVLQ